MIHSSAQYSMRGAFVPPENRAGSETDKAAGPGVYILGRIHSGDYIPNAPFRPVFKYSVTMISEVARSKPGQVAYFQVPGAAMSTRMCVCVCVCACACVYTV